jgi:hypothetical protein
MPILIDGWGEPRNNSNGTKIKSINTFLRHQIDNARPKPSCQVAGLLNNVNLEYETLWDEFNKPEGERKVCINVLDNNCQYDQQIIDDNIRPDLVNKDLFNTLITQGITAWQLDTEGIKLGSPQLFALLGQAGAISGIHEDFVGGTWIVVVEGEQDWYFTENNEQNMQACSDEGHFGNVSRYTKWCRVRLKAGQLWYMPPRTFHVVVKITNCLSIGGHVLFEEWLDIALIGVTECLKDPVLTNDDDDFAQEYFYGLLKVKNSFFFSKETHVASQIVKTRVTRALSISAVNGWWLYLKTVQEVGEEEVSEQGSKKTKKLWKFSQKDIQAAIEHMESLFPKLQIDNPLDSNAPGKIGRKRKR